MESPWALITIIGLTGNWVQCQNNGLWHNMSSLWYLQTIQLVQFHNDFDLSILTHDQKGFFLKSLYNPNMSKSFMMNCRILNYISCVQNYNWTFPFQSWPPTPNDPIPSQVKFFHLFRLLSYTRYCFSRADVQGFMTSAEKMEIPLASKYGKAGHGLHLRSMLKTVG